MPRSSLLKKLPEFMKSTKVLDLAFAEFPEPCVILNTNFEVLKINKAYLKFLNIPKEEIPGQLIFDLFPAEASQDFQEKIKASLEKALHTGELQEVENLGFGVGQSVSYWKLKTVPVKEEYTFFNTLLILPNRLCRNKNRRKLLKKMSVF